MGTDYSYYVIVGVKVNEEDLFDVTTGEKMSVCMHLSEDTDANFCPECGTRVRKWTWSERKLKNDLVSKIPDPPKDDDAVHDALYNDTLLPEDARGTRLLHFHDNGGNEQMFVGIVLADFDDHCSPFLAKCEMNVSDIPPPEHFQSYAKTFGFDVDLTTYGMYALMEAY